MFCNINIDKMLEFNVIEPLNENIFTDDKFLSSYISVRSSNEQARAPIENFHISSDLTSNSCLNQSENSIIINMFSPYHISVNCPIYGSSTNQAIVSPEILI